ncbi:Protein of unknown function DUF3429 [Ostreococcus tauri]|uniref:Uncharacterized protein n=1 Tax=Ostreococcus tauri TaxID=70448 RepID=A0A096PA58_OSTTA|nr:Protein of unknown function DUF3429 [Ostreococcus tauri]OUS45534.1 hypothetical protein BE221DRAFT_148624 [Ostreococcus tauri]CEG01817.1 Protein of unknown function DUF3429 [Ostreococcus tauri]|eukprot:XP_022841188.1 Protein of unknown function DUF3429 [Ostreococcus tauri]
MSSAIAPHALGVLGAVPFVALTPDVSRRLPGLRAVFEPKTVARAQIAYGASVLSFLGGIHWGYAMNCQRASMTPAQMATRYAWGVAPSLLAWQAMAVTPTSEVAACGTLIGGLAMAAGVDTLYAIGGGYPKWMMPTRYALTATACASLVATAFRGVNDDGNDGSEA